MRGGCVARPCEESPNDVRLFVLAEQRFRDLVQQREGNNNSKRNANLKKKWEIEKLKFLNANAAVLVRFDLSWHFRQLFFTKRTLLCTNTYTFELIFNGILNLYSKLNPPSITCRRKYSLLRFVTWLIGKLC